jgi:hypothetical protein
MTTVSVFKDWSANDARRALVGFDLLWRDHADGHSDTLDGRFLFVSVVCRVVVFIRTPPLVLARRYHMKVRRITAAVSRTAFLTALGRSS